MSYADLKIEFRAVVYTSSSHVLEYRVDPNQDLRYDEEKSIFGLFKITRHKKYSTSWHQPLYFFVGTLSEQYSEDDPYHLHPLFIRDKKDLVWYKSNFKTIGDFFQYVNKLENENLATYRFKRKKYLETHTTWY